MKALRQAFQQTGGYTRDGYYIFLLDEALADQEPDAPYAAAGDMPRGKQFGYIFMQHAGNLPRTIAHELGHGIFTLQHSFDNNYSDVEYKGKTGNLMDYADGSELAVWQWRVMANPAPLTWFDTDEDGMSDVIKIDKFIRWIKENSNTAIGKYRKRDFYEHPVIRDKEVYASIQGQTIPYYASLDGDGDVNLKVPEINIQVTGKYHSTFNLVINYSGGGEAFRLWTYSYEHFSLLLNELGYTISRQQQRDIIEQYKVLLNESKNDCNKLDVLYENMPDFVCDGFDDNEAIYGHLKVLANCTIVNTDWVLGSAYNTDETKAISNLFKALDPAWLRNKINAEPIFFEELLNRFVGEYQWQCIFALTEVSAEAWSEQDYVKAPLVLLEPLMDKGTLYQSHERGGIIRWEDISFGGPIATCSPIWIEKGVYTFGYSYLTTEDNFKILDSKALAGRIAVVTTVGPLSPVVVNIGEDRIVIPAICAKDLQIRGFDQSLKELRNLYFGLLLPEIYIGRNNALTRFFQAKATAQGAKTFRVGDLIAGIRINRIKQGSNGKIFVIGRSMDDVTKFADELAGRFGTQNVEIFARGAEGTTNCRFLYQGKPYSNIEFRSLLDDLANGPYVRYTSGPQSNFVVYEEVLNTKLGQLNTAVIQEKIREGYTIIDTGNPRNLGPSGFYDMEILNSFPK